MKGASCRERILPCDVSGRGAVLAVAKIVKQEAWTQAMSPFHWLSYHPALHVKSSTLYTSVHQRHEKLFMHLRTTPSMALALPEA